jgi:tRNA 2-thiocytidine biosynthesis protein TtcA
MDVEKSIVKKFRKEIYHPFIKAIKDYHLINEGDKILVCISGGKDSTLMAILLRYLQRYSEVKFELEYVVMDPGYTEDNLKHITDNLKKLNIDAKIYPTKIFKIDSKIHPKNPCYLCSKMRRGALYNIGKELGCNKIALGHNFDDVIETVMLNMLFNGIYSGMLPILNSENYEGMQLIRPLYLIHEDNIVKWAKYNELEFVRCKCPLTVEDNGKRKEMKALIKELNDKYEYAGENIFNSLNNVNMHNILGYDDGVKHTFHDDYLK